MSERSGSTGLSPAARRAAPFCAPNRPASRSSPPPRHAPPCDGSPAHTAGPVDAAAPAPGSGAPVPPPPATAGASGHPPSSCLRSPSRAERSSLQWPTRAPRAAPPSISDPDSGLHRMPGTNRSRWRPPIKETCLPSGIPSLASPDESLKCRARWLNLAHEGLLTVRSPIVKTDGAKTGRRQVCRSPEKRPASRRSQAVPRRACQTGRLSRNARK